MSIAQSFLNNDNRVIDGKKAAREIIDSIKSRLQVENIVPGLAVVLVGDDPASNVYVRNKSNRAEECGFLSRQHNLHAKTSEAEVLEMIESLNNDSAIHGILVQLPLPDQIDPLKVIQSISAEKDVDGFHYLNAGRLMTGDTEDALLPCTPAGSLYLIKQALGADLSGKHAVVIRPFKYCRQTDGKPAT